MGIDAAIDEMTENKGVLYDPEAVDACLRLFDEKNDQVAS
jgi:response regulator RpfG family c-di-GMP phosphodiesterase